MYEIFCVLPNYIAHFMPNNAVGRHKPASLCLKTHSTLDLAKMQTEG